VGGEYIVSLNSDNKVAFHREVSPWALTSSGTISENTWTHVATVYDGTNITIYINGISSGTLASGNVTGSYNTFYIGNTGGGSYFTGSMDEVRIWDDARTQAEIKANMYAELTGSENNLVAYYNMNAGSGTSLADNSSNSYTGTLTNMDGMV